MSTRAKSIAAATLGVVFVALCAVRADGFAIEPRCVDAALITGGATPEDRVLNAKYAISCARRLGCMVFLLHEDIVEVKPKMLLVFVATLMSYTASQKKH